MAAAQSPLPQELAPPRAAAIAGVLFALLMSSSLVIIRMAVPVSEVDSGAWLTERAKREAVRFGVQLVPFAGVAFLWFIGVLRNRFGAKEDRFFASVFLGSGLLFVASLFTSAAFAGAIVETVAAGRSELVHSDTFVLARQLVGSFLNVFAIKMAGVFIVSTSTIALRTGILPRWVAFAGYPCALVLLFIITRWAWIALLFPAWMLIVSLDILWSEFRPVRRD